MHLLLRLIPFEDPLRIQTFTPGTPAAHTPPCLSFESIVCTPYERQVGSAALPIAACILPAVPGGFIGLQQNHMSTLVKSFGTFAQ